jgi:hypothetical protein
MVCCVLSGNIETVAGIDVVSFTILESMAKTQGFYYGCFRSLRA